MTSEEVELFEPLAGQALGRKPDEIVGQSAAIEEGACAAQTAAQLAGPANEIDRRRGITITQYEKNLEREVNLDVVVRSLEDFGFQIESRTSLLQGTNTNAIWFGKDVTNDDVRLVALTLMGAGVDIRWISRFLDWEGRKRASIEIGSWTAVTEFPPWSTEEVAETPNLAETGNPANPGYRPPGA